MTSIRQGNQSGSKCLVKVGTIGTWAKEAAAKGRGRDGGQTGGLSESAGDEGQKSRAMQLLQCGFPVCQEPQRGRLEEKSTQRKKQRSVLDMLTLRRCLASPVEKAVGCVNLRWREAAWLGMLLDGRMFSCCVKDPGFVP